MAFDVYKRQFAMQQCNKKNFFLHILHFQQLRFKSGLQKRNFCVASSQKFFLRRNAFQLLYNLYYAFREYTL